MKLILLRCLQAERKVEESVSVEDGVRRSSGLSDGGQTLIRGVRGYG